MFSFSIIIPVYNSNIYFLERCLKSVEDQSYKNFECIIINDGTYEPETLNFINELRKKSFYKIIDQPNIGLGQARNTGIKNAKNDYILFLDADDWYEINALEIIDSNLKVDTEVLNFNFNYVYKEHTYKNIDYFTDLEATRNWAGATSWSKAYKRSFIINNDILFFDSKDAHEDEPHWLLICFYLKEYISIDNCLLFYNKMNIESITQNINLINSIQSILNYLPSVKEKIKMKTPSNIFIDYINRNTTLYLLPVTVLLMDKQSYRNFKINCDKILFTSEFIICNGDIVRKTKKWLLKNIYKFPFCFFAFILVKIFRPILKKKYIKDKKNGN